MGVAGWVDCGRVKKGKAMRIIVIVIVSNNNMKLNGIICYNVAMFGN